MSENPQPYNFIKAEESNLDLKQDELCNKIEDTRKKLVKIYSRLNDKARHGLLDQKMKQSDILQADSSTFEKVMKKFNVLDTDLSYQFHNQSHHYITDESSKMQKQQKTHYRRKSEAIVVREKEIARAILSSKRKRDFTNLIKTQNQMKHKQYNDKQNAINEVFSQLSTTNYSEISNRYGGIINHRVNPNYPVEDSGLNHYQKSGSDRGKFGHSSAKIIDNNMSKFTPGLEGNNLASGNKTVNTDAIAGGGKNNLHDYYDQKHKRIDSGEKNKGRGKKGLIDNQISQNDPKNPNGTSKDQDVFSEKPKKKTRFSNESNRLDKKKNVEVEENLETDQKAVDEQIAGDEVKGLINKSEGGDDGFEDMEVQGQVVEGKVAEPIRSTSRDIVKKDRNSSGDEVNSCQTDSNKQDLLLSKGDKVLEGNSTKKSKKRHKKNPNTHKTSDSIEKDVQVKFDSDNLKDKSSISEKNSKKLPKNLSTISKISQQGSEQNPTTMGYPDLYPNIKSLNMSKQKTDDDYYSFVGIPEINYHLQTDKRYNSSCKKNWIEARNNNYQSNKTWNSFNIASNQKQGNNNPQSVNKNVMNARRFRLNKSMVDKKVDITNKDTTYNTSVCGAMHINLMGSEKFQNASKHIKGIYKNHVEKNLLLKNSNMKDDSMRQTEKNPLNARSKSYKCSPGQSQIRDNYQIGEPEFRKTQIAEKPRNPWPVANVGTKKFKLGQLRYHTCEKQFGDDSDLGKKSVEVQDKKLYPYSLIKRIAEKDSGDFIQWNMAAQNEILL